MSNFKPVFRASSTHTIDEKSRIILPVRFRKVIEHFGDEEVMVSRLDGCLVVYPLPAWDILESKVRDNAEAGEDMRQFKRYFIGGAANVPLDKQGRILIPPDLKKYAKLKNEITVAGVIDHFEIWSKPIWDERDQETQDVLLQKEEVKTEIAKLGL
jgi:MraZ protein